MISPRWLWIPCLVLLGACERRPVVTPPAEAQLTALRAERVAAIRLVAREMSSALEVIPLGDPTVDAWLSTAYQLEEDRRYREAGVMLTQAYALQPESPDVLQRLAENAFYLGDYPQAEERALEAYSRGPRLGALCLRHWLLVAEARAEMGNHQAETEAREAAVQCAVQRPPRL